MSTYSTNLGLTLQTTGENPGTWGDVTNVNLGTFLEQAVTGYQSLTFASADITLTLVDGSSSTAGNNYARNMYFYCTGTLGAARNLIVPNRKKLYIVRHAADNFAITVKTSAGTGLAVPQNATMLVYCDGTNVVSAADYFPVFSAAAINNTPIGSTTASTGAFTTITGTTITASTQFSGPHNGTVGATTPNTGVFTTLTCTSANVSVTLSPTGTGTVTVNPATAGTLNNVSIGATTASTGSFTTLAASSTISGVGFTSFLASPTGPIGTTTPVGGRFTFAHTAPVAVTFSATAMAVDCSLSNVFTTTFTANVTTAPTFSNLKDGQTINWFITQDATGSRTMTWPASFKWPGGTAGVLSTAANSVDLVVATYRSATGFWYATLSKAFA